MAQALAFGGLLGSAGHRSPSLILESWGVSGVGYLPGVSWLPAVMTTEESCAV